ncbi:MAG: hypothetical protein HN352_12185 [Bacteroidetes bacterium]|jgi:hypothetical protein|nr:hypothetical protein [Bacteroidota bacterium]MBT3749508.1 hypothetical protein [Bacteroidota bacterium]MBT4401953.1 hypothetical protein [Bacteroidota bacterium]MBT4410613.1 hypothetical protein [Bacteroidota bacterium]MBT5426374.1 hypothetical protein [Bacteroidota bacterium]
MDFRCRVCDVVFQSSGTKKEYVDSIYGPCSKVVANCPTCGGESSEFRTPKQKKSSSSGAIAPCGMSPQAAGCSSCSQ